MSSVPLILQIQAEAVDASASTAALLRKAKIAATKLELVQDLTWIEHELSGYPDPTVLPEYRKLFGALKGKNPFNGWLPIQFPEGVEHVEDTILTVPVVTPIPELENLIQGQAQQKSRELVFQPGPSQVRLIQGWIGRPVEIALFLSTSKVQGIMEAVRNLVLDWSLKLDRAGIHGNGLVFSSQDRERAAPVSQQFFIQNVGTLGDVRDHASVTNNQTATAAINPKILASAIAEIKRHLKDAPGSLKSKLPALLEEVEQESTAEAPDHSRIRRLLQSAKTMAEGAGGSLIATGIGAVLGRLLGL